MISIFLRISVLFLLTLHVESIFAININVAYSKLNSTVDPYEESNLEILRFSPLTFDSLIIRNQQADFIPNLAEEWRVIDEKTTRLFLRKGVEFHSGNIFDAKDVLFTFKRIKESSSFKSLFTPVERVEFVSDYSVDFITKRSFPLLFEVLSNFYPMDSRFYLENENGDKIQEGSFASKNASGTGPFILTAKGDNSLTFERNSRYWKKPFSNIDRLTLNEVEEEKARTTGLLSGTYDVINHFSYDNGEKIDKLPDFDIVNLTGGTLETFLFNLKGDESLQDVKVRQAINYAIDQELIVKKVMKGFASPANQFSPPSFVGHNKKLKYRYDVNHARELLLESGHSGISLDLIVPDEKKYGKEIAYVIKDMLKEIEIDIDIIVAPFDSYWNLIGDGAADLLWVDWYSETFDSNNFHLNLMACRDERKSFGMYNTSRYCNPEVDQLIVLANIVAEPKKRIKILNDVEEILYNDATHLPILWENRTWATRVGIDLLPVLSSNNVIFFGDLIVSE